MIVDESLPLLYACPACGNGYFASSVRSCSIFKRDVFSDGSADIYGYNNLWITRCPRCKSYFPLRYLRSRRAIDPDALEKRFGYVDFYRNGCESRYDLSFWHRGIKTGIFFPNGTPNAEREEQTVLLHLGYWHAMNRHRDECGAYRYMQFCRTLCGMLRLDDDENRVRLAELYRNIGDFDAAIGALRLVRDRRKYQFYCYAIEKTAEKGYSKTAKLNII